ncbi:MAG: hypothetical protein KKH83_03285 [Candidatus Margulisbacteria bacterium]|nr:hypothetical protein [Candidatus Margulisiibacteriota bacterium]
MGIDFAYTTHEADDVKSGMLFRSVFGFKDTNIHLQYGDFGGVWTLLCGSKQDILPAIEKFIHV